jgi:hypothetical protein
MMIVAGVHGNETAGLLAVPRILDLLLQGGSGREGWRVTLISPANPVGVAYGSRYNGQGCDVNRDFASPVSEEARILQVAIAASKPQLIVSLHEGPQEGFLVVVTSRGSAPLARVVARHVSDAGVPLADRHFAGLPLGAPGVSAEGWGSDVLKWVLRLNTLGRHASGLSIGTYTTETPWSSPDSEGRIHAHVVAVEALLEEGPTILDGAGS